MKTNYPEGWDENKVRDVLDYYENQTEFEAVAVDEASLDLSDQIYVEVPKRLLSKIRELIARG